MSDEVVINVHDVENKFTTEKLLDALNGANYESCSISAEVVLAVKYQKSEAVRLLTNRLVASRFQVTATNPNSILFSGDVFGSFKFYQRSKYVSVYGQFWADTEETKKDFIAWTNSLFSNKLLEGTICGLRWAYSSQHGLQTHYLEELLTDVLLDDAYPSIISKYGSLNNFAKQYLESDESVLVLQGPPGTGKSRLIRYLMAKLTEIKNVDTEEMGEEISSGARAKSLVLYTSDTDALGKDELFASFMTSDEIMFVVEDADNLLRSRQSGNDDLHRFLTVSDGIIRNVGRKVIFTTNLPNMSDIDDALIRPGRCFAALSLGGLQKQDALNCAEKLSKNNTDVLKAVESFFAKNRTMSLAEIYKVCKNQNK